MVKVYNGQLAMLHLDSSDDSQLRCEERSGNAVGLAALAPSELVEMNFSNGHRMADAMLQILNSKHIFLHVSIFSYGILRGPFGMT